MKRVFILLFLITGIILAQSWDVSDDSEISYGIDSIDVAASDAAMASETPGSIIELSSDAHSLAVESTDPGFRSDDGGGFDILYAMNFYKIEAEVNYVNCDSMGWYSFEAVITNPNIGKGDANADIAVVTAGLDSAAMQSSTPIMPQTHNILTDGPLVGEGSSITITGTIEVIDPYGHPVTPREICLIFQLSDNDNPWNSATVEVCDIPGPCACDPCEDYEDILVELPTMIQTYEDYIVITNEVTVVSTYPIYQFTSKLVFFSHEVSDSACLGCNPRSEQQGNFIYTNGMSPTTLGFTSSIGAMTDPDSHGHSRELVWTTGDPTVGVDLSGGVGIKFHIGVPPAYSALGECCREDIDVCIRYEFIDTECNVCDVLECFENIHRN